MEKHQGDLTRLLEFLAVAFLLKSWGADSRQSPRGVLLVTAFLVAWSRGTQGWTTGSNTEPPVSESLADPHQQRKPKRQRCSCGWKGPTARVVWLVATVFPLAWLPPDKLSVLQEWLKLGLTLVEVL